MRTSGVAFSRLNNERSRVRPSARSLNLPRRLAGHLASEDGLFSIHTFKPSFSLHTRLIDLSVHLIWGVGEAGRGG